MPSTGAQIQAGEGKIPGLDGLRALAIVAVLVYHLRPGSLTGGFLGVDVFFVVSGFLITTLLIRELRQHGRLQLRRFWVRRARRLLPALVVMLGVTTAAALIAGGDLLVGIGRQLIGALTFSSNWLEIAAGTSYAHQSSPQLFLNLWSLALEEQFYLLWPVLFVVLMAATRTGRQRVAILLTIAAASAIAMGTLFTATHDPTRVYYGTDTHLFGLMIGAALAVSLASENGGILRRRTWRAARVPIALLCLGGLVALMAILTWDSPWTYRGGIVLASLLTAGIITALPQGDNLITRMFSVRPIEWVGQRAYGLYLWHWPIILIVGALAPPAVPDSPLWWLQRAVALALTLLIAAVSYRWLEDPIRRHGFRGCTTRALDALLRPGRVTLPRLAALATGACLVLVTAAVSTAPAQSQAELSMQRAEDAVQARSSQTGDGAAADDDAADEHDARSGDRSAEQSGETDAGRDDAGQDDGGEGDGGEDDGTEDDGTEGDAGDDPEAGDDAADGGALSAVVDVDPDNLGPSMSGFGDSIMYVAAPGLVHTYPDMDIDAVSSRQWPDIATAIESALADDEVRPVVVIAAGTNAGVRDTDVVNDTLDALGQERLVVLITLYGTSTFIEESNENLAAIAEQRPNVVIADWHGDISENLHDLQPDQTHPNWDGMFRFAEVIGDAVRSAL